MKLLISDRLRRISANLRSDLKKSCGTNKTIVFLGGECPEGNEWRENIKKDFNAKILFLDPYDESWKAEDNIYNELEGLLKSDHIVFYKGGEGTDKEKKFLDSLGDKKYESFSNFDDLKKYLDKISGLSSNKKYPIEGALKNIVSSVFKKAYPHLEHDLDLKFEKLDSNTLPILISDIKKGKVIKIDPRVNALIGMDGLKDYSGKEVMSEALKDSLLNLTLNSSKKYHVSTPAVYYDSGTGTIRPINKEMMVPEDTVGPQIKVVKTAKKGQSYSLSSTQVDLPEDMAKQVMSWGKKIPDEELYTEDDGDGGREDEIHVTLLYGLTEESPDQAKKIFSKVKPFEVRLGTITAFLDNDKNDVLKIDVDSPEIHRLHYLLEDSLPNENKYPTYHPHITIAYLKKGEAKKYIGSDPFLGKSFKAKEIIFSSKDGTRIPIKLEP